MIVIIFFPSLIFVLTSIILVIKPLTYFFSRTKHIPSPTDTVDHFSNNRKDIRGVFSVCSISSFTRVLTRDIHAITIAAPNFFSIIDQELFSRLFSSCYRTHEHIPFFPLSKKYSRNTYQSSACCQKVHGMLGCENQSGQ